jgi:hypothetical protein
MVRPSVAAGVPLVGTSLSARRTGATSSRAEHAMASSHNKLLIHPNFLYCILLRNKKRLKLSFYFNNLFITRKFTFDCSMIALEPALPTRLVDVI